MRLIRLYHPPSNSLVVQSESLSRCRTTTLHYTQRSVALGAVGGDTACYPSHWRRSSGPLLLLPPTFNSPVAQSESLHRRRAATIHYNQRSVGLDTDDAAPSPHAGRPTHAACCPPPTSETPRSRCSVGELTRHPRRLSLLGSKRGHSPGRQSGEISKCHSINRI